MHELDCKKNHTNIITHINIISNKKIKIFALG